jgi:hypothetical protein
VSYANAGRVIGTTTNYGLRRENLSTVTSHGFSIGKQIGSLDDENFAQSHSEPQRGKCGLLRHESPQHGVEKK